MKAEQLQRSHVDTLRCPQCAKLYNVGLLQGYATCCNQPLVATYDYNIRIPDDLKDRAQTIWRYRELLPVIDDSNIVSLGEGWTPVYQLSSPDGAKNVNILLKDEGMNPTGSFKARGISVAVSKAKELDVTHCVMPTAGNAGGALSAYCAKAGIKATVIMPRYTPATLQQECSMYGAELILVDGMIDRCGTLAMEVMRKTNAFNMATMKEPYRLEGKKTMGYEIAEQLNWQLPDVIIYPTGGGTGLIGMWKAFGEMIQMGWLSCKLPRMVVVQAEGCCPIVQLFEHGKILRECDNNPSCAYGLAVPKPFARDMVMQVLSDSNGTAVSVMDEEIDCAVTDLARSEGVALCPEGGSTYAALKKLLHDGWVGEGETVLLFNTGVWYKYQ